MQIKGKLLSTLKWTCWRNLARVNPEGKSQELDCSSGGSLSKRVVFLPFFSSPLDSSNNISTSYTQK